MTGTADTEAAEFKKIYNLDVVVIPTNKPMVRIDDPDVIYKTKREKYDAAIEEIIALNKKGQPVLVGTISIDVSEDISRKLKKRGVRHNVLNAKNHEKEAEIISQAGQPGAVTISTNMAGRGTDIVLGDGVVDVGGLRIIGTERHESRRIDNQLRGRAGRQGDPGSSRFYLALEDDLLRIFGGERMTRIMEKLGMQEGEPIEHNLLSRAIENAQSKVEGQNFEIRKQLLEYDDVMNQQREVIYKRRREILTGKSLEDDIADMIAERIEMLADNIVEDKVPPEEWDFDVLDKAVFKQFNFHFRIPDDETLENLDRNRLIELIDEATMTAYRKKEAEIGEADFRNLERYVLLQNIDSMWKDHLLSMDHLKEGIGLRGYAQQNPLLIYKKEGYEMFADMMDRVAEETLGILFRIEIAAPQEIEQIQQKKEQDLVFSGSGDAEPPKRKPVKRKEKKVGRNAPCPCGSGKKYKKCCGR